MYCVVPNLTITPFITELTATTLPSKLYEGNATSTVEDIPVVFSYDMNERTLIRRSGMGLGDGREILTYLHISSYITPTK
jgi:hypothetical protein